ncbi:MAG TPA: ribosome biogenesis GTP-binding protein YihA/YsxC [Thermoclostridium sp.]|nr:YihA family ribosome biogenesis GTP-binding protein [Clostridiaceae bacterium]HOQ75074.1 ribosome biogenesis GTP-binding protein YihA/YsxC [Thermoclostridium sp.]HPU45833.1 ribosome biogenesis GTP-binding protein YihA/YsxC [Thermoclostridium sp.]
MVIKKAEHVISAVQPSQYPNTMFPEIALAGRSNVGKSSLVNALVNRKNLARVGSTPGKTRVINFYNINDSLMIADLPGYGYAKVSLAERENWGKLCETYLNTRKQLKAIILLVDIRHEPSPDDRVMLGYVRESGRKFVVVANKADKVGRSEMKKHMDNIRSALGLDEGVEVLPFSAIKKTGVEALWQKIEEILRS